MSGWKGFGCAAYNHSIGIFGDLFGFDTALDVCKEESKYAPVLATAKTVAEYVMLFSAPLLITYLGLHFLL